MKPIELRIKIYDIDGIFCLGIQTLFQYAVGSNFNGGGSTLTKYGGICSSVYTDFSSPTTHYLIGTNPEMWYIPYIHICRTQEQAYLKKLQVLMAVEVANNKIEASVKTPLSNVLDPTKILSVEQMDKWVREHA